MFVLLPIPIYWTLLILWLVVVSAMTIRWLDDDDHRRGAPDQRTIKVNQGPISA